MQYLVKYLFLIIQAQKEIISYLCIFLFGKKPSPDKITDKKYSKLSVDPLPVLGKPKVSRIYDCNTLIASNNIKPVKRRSSNTVPTDTLCPYCGANHTYIYNNNGSKGQFLCKVCHSTFFPHIPSKDVELCCPFCNYKLSLAKKRKSFDVFRCSNIDCSYRKRKLKAMSTEQRALYKSSPHLFKMRYIYRKFNIDFTPLSKDSPIKTNVDLSHISASPHVLGLILTYHINYGLPLRKTAALMYDVHNVKISHQTIANYCNAVAPIVKPFVDNYQYELSNSFCGDETYIKVKGRWQYIFFFFDSVKKIILSYRVSKHRDYLSAIYAINDVLLKLPSLPSDLNFITDGNPIYLLAKQFFAQRGIDFDVTQVIGLSNQDDVSSEFRPLKQIIERLNRTFKGNYKPTTGYGSDDGAISSVTLFVAYFNFLRPHSMLENNVPAVIPQLANAPNMPAKWLLLISLSQNYLKSLA